MNIKVLGAGCHNCRVFETAIKDTIDELNIDATIEEIEDINEIMSYGIMFTPGLIIDNKIVSSGKIPSQKEIKEILTNSINNSDPKIQFSTNQEQIARICFALSHPIRIYILEMLNSSHICFTNSGIIGENSIDHETLAEHLKILKNAGLIQGEIIPPKISFCINRINMEVAKILITNYLK